MSDRMADWTEENVSVSVQDGSMPREAARAVARAAFPMTTDAEIDTIFDALVEGSINPKTDGKESRTTPEEPRKDEIKEIVRIAKKVIQKYDPDQPRDELGRFGEGGGDEGGDSGSSGVPSIMVPRGQGVSDKYAHIPLIEANAKVAEWCKESGWKSAFSTSSSTASGQDKAVFTDLARQYSAEYEGFEGAVQEYGDLGKIRAGSDRSRAGGNVNGQTIHEEGGARVGLAYDKDTLGKKGKGLVRGSVTNQEMIIHHEFAHVLNRVHDLESLPEVREAFSKPYSTVADKVSIYATKNPSEFVSECWAKYRGNAKTNPMVEKVGRAIEAKIKGAKK